MTGDIITYEYWGSLYINMTNRCDCHCIFCIRDQDASALGGLWLREEPAKEEVLEDIEMDTGSETKRLIEKFVDENPEAAATLLRNWLNEDYG